jgi:hypothetical protein
MALHTGSKRLHYGRISTALALGLIELLAPAVAHGGTATLIDDTVRLHGCGG